MILQRNDIKKATYLAEDINRLSSTAGCEQLLCFSNHSRLFLVFFWGRPGVCGSQVGDTINSGDPTLRQLELFVNSLIRD
jgi:hypothetical protein